MIFTFSSLASSISNSSLFGYIFLFLGSYFETLIGPGFFIYGEFFFLSGAVLAGAGVLNIWIVSAVCILGGVLGDSSSYYIGKRYGKYVREKLFKKKNKYLNVRNYSRGVKYFNAYGKKSIFFSRLMGPLSWITPFLAGILHVKYKDFLKYNIPGVVVGIGWFLVVGYFFGFSYSIFLDKIQKEILYVVIPLMLFALIFLVKKFKIFEKIAFLLKTSKK